MSPADISPPPKMSDFLKSKLERGLTRTPKINWFCLKDLFYLIEMTQEWSFVDDTTFYVCDKDLNTY